MKTGLSARGWLFVSLAVNLLCVGVIAGAALGGFRPFRGAAIESAADPFRPGAFVRSLEPETRRAVVGDLLRAFGETRQERAALRAARAEVAAAVVAEPYDPERMRAAFARMRAANGAVQSAWHDAVAQALTRLSAQDRRALVDRVTRGGNAAQWRALRDQADAEAALTPDAPPAPPAPAQR